MSILRFSALEKLPFINYRKDNFVETPPKLSELFCENVFPREMREFLTKEAFTAVMDAIKNGTKNPKVSSRPSGSRYENWAMTKRRYSLHALVSAIDRNYCGKA